MSNCKICRGTHRDSPDSIVICDHHQGSVHLGCCLAHCSWDNKPCQNCQGIFAKVD